MKFAIWLKQSEKLLSDSGVATARLDVLVLAEYVTGIDRSKLLAEPDMEISSDQTKKLEKLLSRRTQHEPLAYILGQNEFYGRTFVVNEHVLEPRPESETMIDELKLLEDLPAEPYIADIGTGSGALGITAKLELPKAKIDLIDIDAKALKVAKTNVDKLTSGLKLVKNDLLANIEQAYDVLLCNLPYVPDDFQINTAASHEPRLAIFGGRDGLDLYRKLFEQIKIRSNVPLYFLTESLPSQHTQLEKLAMDIGYEMVKENDFIQVFNRIQK